MPEYHTLTIEEIEKEFGKDLDHPAVLAASNMRQANTGEPIDEAAFVKCAFDNLKNMDRLLAGTFD